MSGDRRQKWPGERAFEAAVYGQEDRIVSGHEFLKTLLGGNLILAPAAMARRECYERVSDFPVGVTWGGKPIDLIWGGDWYLWCVFALFFDVGYMAEPISTIGNMSSV